MRQLASVGLCVTIGALLFSFACSSSDSDGGASASGGATGRKKTSVVGGESSHGSSTAPSNGGTSSIEVGLGQVTSSPALVPALPPDSSGMQEIPPERVTEFQSQACNGWTAEPETAASALVFVVDVSGTMRSSTDSTGDQNKYEVTRDALKAALSELPESVSVGLTFYPNKGNGGSRDEPADLGPCINQDDNVQVALLGNRDSEQRKALDAALDSVEPDSKGATPTHDAFNIAREMLKSQPAEVGKYVAVLTDGQPTLLEGCYGRAAPKHPEDAQPIIDAISAAHKDFGMKTFIVGSPGSEENQGTGEDSRGWLSEAARAGETATNPDCSDAGPSYCHLDMTTQASFGAALRDGLKTITSKVLVSCLYDVPAPPEGKEADASATNLVYGDGKGGSFLILQNGSDNCDKGWHYIHGTSQIEICGSTCDELTGNPNATLSLLFGCSAITIQNPLQ